MPTDQFKTAASEFRTCIAQEIQDAEQLRAALIAGDQLEGQNKGEMIANVTLALRHLEDASMRFGKAMQASSGGISPLGGPNTPGTTKVN